MGKKNKNQPPLQPANSGSAKFWRANLDFIACISGLILSFGLAFILAKTIDDASEAAVINNVVFLLMAAFMLGSAFSLVRWGMNARATVVWSVAAATAILALLAFLALSQGALAPGWVFALCFMVVTAIAWPLGIISEKYSSQFPARKGFLD